MTHRPLALGLMGGTFDPPHAGHIAAARFALERFGLARVELVPSFSPPHKPGRPLSAPYHRYAMTVLATLPEVGLTVSWRELVRGGVSYTIDTLREARAASPGTAIVFVLGTDQFAEIATWREPRAIVEEFGLIVVGRPGTGFRAAVAALPDWAAGAVRDGRIREAAMEPVDLSATEVRGRVASGRSIAGLVAEGVSQYIDRYELYRSGG